MQKILRTIFLLYIFLFPFQLISFLSVFKNMFSSSAAIGNDFFVLIIGLLLIVIVDGGKIYFETGSIVRQGVKLVFELLIIGIITSIILFFPLGTLYGENSITASFSQNIYLVVTGITFYFNFRLFKCLSKKDIEKVLDFLCVFMTVLGIVQVLIILSFPAVGSFYDSVDIFGLLPNSNYMTKMHRICLSSSEPSGIGHIVGVLLLPYVLGQIIDGERKYKNRYCLWGILLVVISFFSFSSTVYASILIDLIVFIFLKIKGKKGAIFLFVVFVLCLLGFFLWDEVLVNTYFGKQMNYRLIDWEKDSQMICSAVNKVANTEIRSEPYIHWWTFMGYYSAVGESLLSSVVSIRDKMMRGKKLEKYEQEFRRNNPEYFVWNTDSVADEEAEELFKQLWNKSGGNIDGS